MPANSQPLRVAVARAGAAAKHGDPDRIADARQNLAAERLASYVSRVIANAPPLTPAQKDRIAGLLNGTRAAE